MPIIWGYILEYEGFKTLKNGYMVQFSVLRHPIWGLLMIIWTKPG